MQFIGFNEEREEGFSLVELLVVIVIIGILSSIAIAAFMNQRKKAVDASLESDLKTIAIGISTILMDKSPEDLREIFGKDQSHVSNVSYEKLLSSPEWNSAENLPDFHVSEGNIVEITVMTRNDANWTDKFEPGDFCLTATNPNSSYNYAPGSGKVQEYNRMLFYDVRAGGIKTMEGLSEIVENDGDISCKGYYNRYTKAIGK